MVPGEDLVGPGDDGVDCVVVLGQLAGLVEVAEPSEGLEGAVVVVGEVEAVELDAFAELVGQDAAAAQQGLAWRSGRGWFLKYHAGLNPAIAHYYAKEMIRCITDMLRHAITPGPARALHRRAQKLLWEIEDDVEYEMYCHDVASFEYAYPQTAEGSLPADTAQATPTA